MEEQELKPLVLDPPLNTFLVNDGAGLDRLAKFFNRCRETKQTTIGWDTETDPKKDFYWRRARTWQFGNRDEQHVIDLLSFVDGNPDLLFSSQGDYGKNLHNGLRAVLNTVAPVLESAEFLKVGVNLSFEYLTARWNFGLYPWHFYSCDVAERVIQAGAHSLKDYPYYSMASMIGRYWGVKVDKEQQKTFNLTDPLTEEQVWYAALDTRLPLALRTAQMRIAEGARLTLVTQIENDAIGAFQDMTIHGQRINTTKWDAIDDKNREILKQVIIDLDKFFIPLVSTKHDVITDKDIAEKTTAWKAFNVVTPEELALKAQFRTTKNFEFEQKREQLENARKEQKERLKKIAGDLSKKRTKIRQLVDQCEGEALINYGSSAQLLKVLREIKGLEKMEDTDDGTLSEYEHYPIIAKLQQYRVLSKKIDTYGKQWTKAWVTGPGKKIEGTKQQEGWLHPGDNRLRPVFNQLDTETGRSSSEKPNGQNIPKSPELRACFEADPPDADEPEGYVIVTSDMSGAELRIMAELANAKTFIDAFSRDEDVHSVCTELMQPTVWRELALPDCKYYALREDGTPKRMQCKCPGHIELRNKNKVPNFLLPYGGGAYNLASELGIPISEAEEIMEAHHEAFPDLWEYLERSGNEAYFYKESRDLFDRRRQFPDPTWDEAKHYSKTIHEKKLRLSEAECKKNLNDFMAQTGRKPKGGNKSVDSEVYKLTHREPGPVETSKAHKALCAAVRRQGKNHCIQGSNATIAKLAMGCGFDKDGKPFLWHTLRQLKAKLLAFVHDELVILCPKRFGQRVADLVGDAFRRAAAEKMTKVVMKFSFNIEPYWCK